MGPEAQSEVETTGAGADRATARQGCCGELHGQQPTPAQMIRGREERRERELIDSLSANEREEQREHQGDRPEAREGEDGAQLESSGRPDTESDLHRTPLQVTPAVGERQLPTARSDGHSADLREAGSDPAWRAAASAGATATVAAQGDFPARRASLGGTERPTPAAAPVVAVDRVYEGGRLVEQQTATTISAGRREMAEHHVTESVELAVTMPYSVLLRERYKRNPTDRWAYGWAGEWRGAYKTREAAERAAVRAYVRGMIAAGLTPDAPSTRMVWTLARQPAQLYMDAEDVFDALRGCAAGDYEIDVPDEYPVVAEHWRDDLARRVNDAIEEWRIAAGVEWPTVVAEEPSVSEVAVTPELVTQVRLELAAAEAASLPGEGSRA